MKIVTHCIFPPIPDRRWDWQAVTDEYDGAPDAPWWRKIAGYGSTEEEAIADLEAELEGCKEVQL